MLRQVPRSGRYFGVTAGRVCNQLQQATSTTTTKTTTLATVMVLAGGTAREFTDHYDRCRQIESRYCAAWRYRPTPFLSTPFTGLYAGWSLSLILLGDRPISVSASLPRRCPSAPPRPLLAVPPTPNVQRPAITVHRVRCRRTKLVFWDACIICTTWSEPVAGPRYTLLRILGNFSLYGYTEEPALVEPAVYSKTTK